MSRPTTSTPHIGVIGGGISGLAAAHCLVREHPSVTVTLLEAESRAGGLLRTNYRDGFLHELAADNFLVTPEQPWARELAERLGYADQLVETNPQHRRALVYWQGQLHPIPEGFHLLGTAHLWPILRSRLLTWRGKARLACERFIPQRVDVSDESLSAFATRRLGREVYERLVQPLVAGIYTADPDRLSVAAALPQFAAMERQFGSLTRGMLRRTRTGAAGKPASGARYALFAAPRHGMQHFVDHLVQTLPPTIVRTGVAAVRVARIGNRSWQVDTHRSAAPLVFDGLIVAIPAWQAAQLLDEADRALATSLRQIRYANAAVVALAVRKDQMPRPVDAFGIVVPAAAGRSILAVSFSSAKFPGRAPEGHVLVRVFIGGALQESLVDLDDVAMKSLVQDELQTMIGLRGQPVWWHVQRWYQATPQYELGHLDRVARIEQLVANSPNLALAGNGYRGVGIPQCIHSGEQAARRIIAAITAVAE